MCLYGQNVRRLHTHTRCLQGVEEGRCDWKISQPVWKTLEIPQVSLTPTHHPAISLLGMLKRNESRRTHSYMKGYRRLMGDSPW